jgi:hypothetical protein
MKLNLKRVSSIVAASALALTGMVGISAPAANAAVAASTTIRLVSPVLNNTNSFDGQADADLWVSNEWFAEGMTYRNTWAPVSSTVNLTYHVTDSVSGLALVNKEVKLRIGKAYAGSTAIIQVGNKETATEDFGGLDYGANGGAGDPFGRAAAKDQLNVMANTDLNGNVTFTLKHVMRDTGVLKTILPEPQPTDFGAKGAALKLENSAALYTQIYPEVDGQGTDKTDMTEIHYYAPTNAPSGDKPAKASVRLTTPTLSDSNSINRTDLVNEFTVANQYYPVGFGFRQAYLPIGATVNLVYHVADDAGAAIQGAAFKLHVNKAYSKSNAKVTNGTTATDPSIDNAGGNDQAIWESLTDAFGNVSFNMTNTDTAGEGAIQTVGTSVPGAANGGVYSQIYPEVATVDQADMTEFHFFKLAPVSAAVKVSITASGRTIKVTLTNAKSKKALIKITGLKNSTKTPTKATATVYSFKVSKGTKTVSVVVNGKTTKKSLKIK